MKQEVFSGYVNDVFVETGTFIGDGVRHALKFGFKEVYSIELSKGLYEQCCESFKENKNVNIVFGDSGEVLGDVIKPIEKPITFWLDGHFHPHGYASVGNEGRHQWGKSKDGCWTPLWRELDAIAAHPIKTHTILIDDLRELHKSSYGSIQLENLRKRILEINENYDFVYHKGVVEDDILAAVVR